MILPSWRFQDISNEFFYSFIYSYNKRKWKTGMLASIELIVTKNYNMKATTMCLYYMHTYPSHFTQVEYGSSPKKHLKLKSTVIIIFSWFIVDDLICRWEATVISSGLSILRKKVNDKNPPLREMEILPLLSAFWAQLMRE